MANGLIDTSTLTPVRSQPHLRLTRTAEASLAAVRATILAVYGWVLVLTDAYRSYTEQERIFRARYTTTYLPGRPSKTWQGRRWYLRAGYAAAAVPGTSNHGLGITVDVANLGGFGGTKYHQFAAVAGPAGWSNAEGRSIGEAWHWNLLSGGAPVTNPIGGGSNVPDVVVTPPTPIAPEDWFDMATQTEIQAAFTAALAAQRPYDRVLFRSNNTYYEHDVAARTYTPIPNPRTLDDIKAVRERSGLKVLNWDTYGAVDNPAAFGRLV